MTLVDYLIQSRDWVNPTQTRTPEQYPYSFDAYYVWRTDISDSSPVWTDRMWQQNPELAQVAFSGRQRVREMYPEQCQQIIRDYYGPDWVCTGFALGCNQSTGYEIGCFYIKKVG